MKYFRRMERLFWFAVILLLLMSATILIMPFAAEWGEQNRAIVVLVGILFWVTTIGGYTLLGLAGLERKKHIKQNKISNDARIGIVTFFANRPAMVADITMILSLLLFIGLNFTIYKNDYIAYVLLFLFLASVNMHGLFNGRIYKLLKNTKEKK